MLDDNKLKCKNEKKKKKKAKQLKAICFKKLSVKRETNKQRKDLGVSKEIGSKVKSLK